MAINRLLQEKIFESEEVLLMTTAYEDVLKAFILKSIAEFERELIKSRTSEGRAKLRGVRFGRKPAPTQFQREEAIARREAGETLADTGRIFGVSHSTISRL